MRNTMASWSHGAGGGTTNLYLGPFTAGDVVESFSIVTTMSAASLTGRVGVFPAPAGADFLNGELMSAADVTLFPATAGANQVVVPVRFRITDRLRYLGVRVISAGSSSGMIVANVTPVPLSATKPLVDGGPPPGLTSTGSRPAGGSSHEAQEVAALHELIRVIRDLTDRLDGATVTRPRRG